MVPDLSLPRRVHVVGAGGSVMGSIGETLLAMGHTVSGSDAVPSAVLDRLAARGARTWVGHDPAGLAGVDLVAASTAVPADDPELAAARAAGVPVVRRAEVLAALCALRRTVAVAGAHGKTSTSAMLATLLHHAGLADPRWTPSFLVGGLVSGLGTGAAWVPGEWLVVEADESDGTFLELGPEAVVVTNVEPDHLDHWGSFDALVEGYRRFVADAPGPRVVCADDPGAAAVAAAVGGCVTYGFDPAAVARIDGDEPSEGGTRFRLRHGEAALSLWTPAPGRHNVRNAAASAVVALELGVPPRLVEAGVAAFGGVARRFERRGRAGGVTFVDSYDHLPAEVASVLAAARAGGWDRVVCVFQPHRPTRIRDLWRDFADAFVDADVLAVTDVYVPVGQVAIPGVTGRLIVDAVVSAHPDAAVAWLPTRAEVKAWLEAELRPGDLCLTLNAGDLTTLPDELLAARG
ncbi:MAG: UDP-N-acetylmuramate--L-alanine ligase [Acidimicrobiia bacterium]